MFIALFKKKKTGAGTYLYTIIINILKRLFYQIPFCCYNEFMNYFDYTKQYNTIGITLSLCTDYEMIRNLIFFINNQYYSMHNDSLI